MKSVIRDGKLVLCREKLKQLRQQKGLSQERLAEQCAARGYRISLPSIKRAETRRHVLYRTATELAGFFDVELGYLLSHTQADTLSASVGTGAGGNRPGR